MPPFFFSLETVGGRDFPRFLISNPWGEYWTGASWSTKREDGFLYSSRDLVTGDIHNLLVEFFPQKKHCFRYVAPVYVEIRSDEPIDQKVIQEWLHQSARLLIDPSTTIGPTDNSLGLVEIDWSSLRKEENGQKR